MSARVDHAVATGTFSLDGQTWEVENNLWAVGDDARCVLIDPAHSVETALELAAGREVEAVLLTHGHDDHVRAALDVAEKVHAPVFLHPNDQMLWDAVHPGHPVDGDLEHGMTIPTAGTSLTVLHTPGHSPGSVCFYAPELGESGILFSGDTLFRGGPGATGRSYSDFGTIISSITEQLLVLPAETVVHTGHGESTTVGAEAPNRQLWIDRGH